MMTMVATFTFSFSYSSRNGARARFCKCFCSLRYETSVVNLWSLVYNPTFLCTVVVFHRFIDIWTGPENKSAEFFLKTR